MSQSVAPANTLRHICPRQFRLEYLLGFWVMAVLLPAAAIFCLLNFSEYNSREAQKTRVTDTMLEMFDKLQKACQPGDYFAARIKLAEHHAGLPERDANFIPAENSMVSAPQNLQRLFSRLKNFDLLLLITSDSSEKDVKVFTDQIRSPDYPKPGMRAAREIMKEFHSQSDSVMPMVSQKTGNRKILKNFSTAMFGTYLDPLNANEDFLSGFSEKSGGNRLWSARRLVRSADGKPLFSYLALFREADNSLAHSFSLAKRELANSGFSFHLKMRPAIPFPFVFEEADGRLRLTGPIQFGLLMTGFFQNKDILTGLVDRGIMQHKPAIYPHFDIIADHQTFAAAADTIRPGFLIFMFLCLSLLMIKSFHQHGNIQVGIRTRLFLSVLLATAMPTAIFVFYTQRHVSRDFSQRQNQMNLKIKSNLRQLELAVKSVDQVHYSRFNTFLNRIKEAAPVAGEEELRQLLNSGFDKTFSGVSLIRNDGMILENLDHKKVSVVRLEKKLNITREFMYASVIRFFQFMGLMPESLLKKLQTSSRGKKLLAISEIFNSTDIDNFCGYEGSTQTSRQDFGNFRLMNCKILPSPVSNEKYGAVLILIQDIRELGHLIIDELSQNWSFFRQETDEGIIETSVISCFDLDNSSLDTNKVWPSAKALNNRQLAIAKLLTNGRSEAEMVLEEEDGTPIIISGQKIAGFPLIALAEIHMQKISEQRSLVFAVIGGNIVYILMLLSILTSILTELFKPPIDRLLTAARLTGEGFLVQINNNFKNELSHLTGEFNKMSQQIKERERLERFISREAAQTIAAESRDHSEIASQRVNRTIIFIHIRHFNKLNTSLAPEKLFDLLNIFFPFVEQSIDAAGGQIDKYIGDAIMAVFADQPEQSSSAASRACQAVVNIRNGLPDLNAKLSARQLPAIEIGTGVSSGEVISGRIGSYQGRLDFTVIGDRVNLAARLEAASHFASASSILIDEATCNQAGHLFNYRVHGEINIKGKALPVKTYEIIA